MFIKNNLTDISNGDSGFYFVYENYRMTKLVTDILWLFTRYWNSNREVSSFPYFSTCHRIRIHHSFVFEKNRFPAWESVEVLLGHILIWKGAKIVFTLIKF